MFLQANAPNYFRRRLRKTFRHSLSRGSAKRSSSHSSRSMSHKYTTETTPAPAGGDAVRLRLLGRPNILGQQPPGKAPSGPRSRAPWCSWTSWAPLGGIARLRAADGPEGAGPVQPGRGPDRARFWGLYAGTGSGPSLSAMSSVHVSQVVGPNRLRSARSGPPAAPRGSVRCAPFQVESAGTPGATPSCFLEWRSRLGLSPAMIIVWMVLCELFAVVSFWAAKHQAGPKRWGMVTVGVALTALCFWIAMKADLFPT